MNEIKVNAGFDLIKISELPNGDYIFSFPVSPCHVDFIFLSNINDDFLIKTKIPLN